MRDRRGGDFSPTSDFEASVEMIMSGEIKDAKTQTAILKLKLLKDNGEI